MAKKKTQTEPKKIQLTAQGLAELKAELQQLVDVKLPEVIKRVAVARSHGDLSENAEYHNAKEEQDLTQTRIDEIEEIISKAQVVKQTKSHNKVGMGSTVTVNLAGKTAKRFTYHIVGEFEANPKEGKVSIDSPIGSALVDAKKGDEVSVDAPAGKVTYKIIDIK